VAVALIVAAGSGERLGAPRPKAFVTLAGKPMVQWSVDVFRAVSSIERMSARMSRACRFSAPMVVRPAA